MLTDDCGSDASYVTSGGFEARMTGKRRKSEVS
jgi:hypothetical protein